MSSVADKLPIVGVSDALKISPMILAQRTVTEDCLAGSVVVRDKDFVINILKAPQNSFTSMERSKITVKQWAGIIDDRG